MELIFLGTSAGKPVRDRNVSSIVLNINSSELWMFDCGEGTQHQLLKTNYKLTKVKKLFITHLHGDHVFGIPGLLSSISALGVTEPFDLYGPVGIRELVETLLRVSETHLGFSLNIAEIEHDGVLFEERGITVSVAKLEHRIACYGYRIEECERTGPLNVKWLTSIGLPPGPLYGQLKSGQDITLDDGQIIRALEAVGKPIPGRIISILGDTSPCEASKKLSMEADVLIHEATFTHDLLEKAKEFGHSTTVQAAETASRAGVKKLFITHFSSRYKLEELSNLEAEAREVFDKTEAALELKPYKI